MGPLHGADHADGRLSLQQHLQAYFLYSRYATPLLVLLVTDSLLFIILFYSFLSISVVLSRPSRDLFAVGPVRLATCLVL